MIEGCLELWPARACGYHGECVDIFGVNKSMCECDAGWSITNEYNYFGEISSDEQTIIGLCTYNFKVVRYLWLTAACLSGVAVLLIIGLTCIKCESRNRLKRSVVALTLVLAFSCSVYRFTNSDALFGHDLGFTILISNAYASVFINGQVNLSRYMKVLNSKLLRLSRTTVRVFLQNQSKLYVLDVLVFQIGWITCFTKENPLISLKLIRTVTGYGSVRSLIFWYYTRHSLQLHIAEMKDLLDTIGNRISNGSATSTGSTLQVPVRLHADVSFESWLRRHLPRAKRLNTNTHIICFSSVFYLGLPTVWNFWLPLITYCNPLMIMVWSLMMISGISSSISKAKSKHKHNSWHDRKRTNESFSDLSFSIRLRKHTDSDQTSRNPSVPTNPHGEPMRLSLVQTAYEESKKKKSSNNISFGTPERTSGILKSVFTGKKRSTKISKDRDSSSALFNFIEYKPTLEEDKADGAVIVCYDSDDSYV
uniref:EGF-like domain-containing protein n=1 Tax=Aplanochytrium stocchinoi TaxID=215587 RepID=A0A7S3V1B4_9STRA